MSHSIDCIVCGTCVADVLVRPVPLERPVGGGRLFHVDPIEVTTGGIVCNTGVALRRLGAAVETAADNCGRVATVRACSIERCSMMATRSSSVSDRHSARIGRATSMTSSARRRAMPRSRPGADFRVSASLRRKSSSASGRTALMMAWAISRSSDVISPA